MNTEPKFEMTCGQCEAKLAFHVDRAVGLVDYIEDQLTEARAETRDEVELEFAGFVRPEEALDERDLQDLSLAIRRRDWSEAELLVDRIADKTGTHAQEMVAQGRFNLRAAVVA